MMQSESRRALFQGSEVFCNDIPLAFFGLRILEGLLVSSQGVLSLSLWRVSVTEIPLYLLFSNVVISFLSRQEALHFRFLVLSNLLLDQLLLRLPLIERYIKCRRWGRFRTNEANLKEWREKGSEGKKGWREGGKKKEKKRKDCENESEEGRKEEKKERRKEGAEDLKKNDYIHERELKSNQQWTTLPSITWVSLSFLSNSRWCLSWICSRSLENFCMRLSYSLSSLDLWSSISVRHFVSAHCSNFWCCCLIRLYPLICSRISFNSCS